MHRQLATCHNILIKPGTIKFTPDSVQARSSLLSIKAKCHQLIRIMHDSGLYRLVRGRWRIKRWTQLGQWARTCCHRPEKAFSRSEPSVRFRSRTATSCNHSARRHVSTQPWVTSRTRPPHLSCRLLTQRWFQCHSHSKRHLWWIIRKVQFHLLSCTKSRRCYNQSFDSPWHEI